MPPRILFVDNHKDTRDMIAAALDEGAHDIAAQASAAWESAICWDDEHAVRRLVEVRAV
jgi:hypothetical protein